MDSIDHKREVINWLEELYGGKAPQFDATDKNLLPQLYKLMKHCKETEKDAKISTDFQQRQITEYQDETERMNEKLKSLGMSPESKLSLENEDLNNLVNTLADVADLLGVDNPSEEDLDLALAGVRLRASQVHSYELKRQQKIEKEKRDMLENIQKLSQSEKALAHENKEGEHKSGELKNLSKRTDFLLEKMKEYSKSVESYKLTLSRNGCRSEILHENLMELKQELDRLEVNELKPKEAKLKGYHGLPASLGLAKAKIAEAENELECLTRELTKEISALHV